MTRADSLLDRLEPSGVRSDTSVAVPAVHHCCCPSDAHLLLLISELFRSNVCEPRRRTKLSSPRCCLSSLLIVVAHRCSSSLFLAVLISQNMPIIQALLRCVLQECPELSFLHLMSRTVFLLFFNSSELFSSSPCPGSVFLLVSHLFSSYSQVKLSNF